MSRDHALPTRHFPDTGTAAMEFLLKNHPLAKDNQELQAQNRDLKAENQELANRLEKAFQKTRAIRQRAEAAEAERDRVSLILDRITAAANSDRANSGDFYFAEVMLEALKSEGLIE